MTDEFNPKDKIGSTKIPLAIVSEIAVAEEALALVEGGCKYGDYNYRGTAVRASIYMHAARRHLACWFNGEERDPVTGVHHLGSARACLGILLDAQAIDKLVDDRPPSNPQIKAILDGLEAKVKHLQQMHADKSPKHWTIADNGQSSPSLSSSRSSPG